MAYGLLHEYIDLSIYRYINLSLQLLLRLLNVPTSVYGRIHIDRLTCETTGSVHAVLLPFKYSTVGLLTYPVRYYRTCLRDFILAVQPYDCIQTEIALHANIQARRRRRCQRNWTCWAKRNTYIGTIS